MTKPVYTIYEQQTQISLRIRSLISTFVVRCLYSIITIFKYFETLPSVAEQAGLNLCCSQTSQGRFSCGLAQIQSMIFLDIPKSKLDDQSFSRAWSKSEATAAGTAGHTGSFERQQTKYKSDGKVVRLNFICYPWQIPIYNTLLCKSWKMVRNCIHGKIMEFEK